ncbi:MAG: M23 family metallopeptidase [Alphaproteobacteria bacterium]
MKEFVTKHSTAFIVGALLIFIGGAAYFGMDALKRQKIKAAIKKIVDDGKFDGSFYWPWSGPITSPFGMRTDPFNGSQKMHNGIDIDGETGDPIHATAPGIVYEVATGPEAGKRIRIEHPGGITSHYFHLSAQLVKDGDQVDENTVIGLMGATGKRVTGSHLHFGMKQNGSWIDPASLLT